MSNHNIIALDPGTNGGIALYEEAHGNVGVDPMPEGMTGIVDYLREISAHHPNLTAVVEKVGGYMPGNSGPAACKFARHCGNLEATLYALRVPIIDVTPNVWMKGLGSFPKDKKDRKNAIKELMSRTYPHLKVSLKTSDALGVLTWYLGK